MGHNTPQSCSVVQTITRFGDKPVYQSICLSWLDRTLPTGDLFNRVVHPTNGARCLRTKQPASSDVASTTLEMLRVIQRCSASTSRKARRPRLEVSVKVQEAVWQVLYCCIKQRHVPLRTRLQLLACAHVIFGMHFNHLATLASLVHGSQLLQWSVSSNSNCFCIFSPAWLGKLDIGVPWRFA